MFIVHPDTIGHLKYILQVLLYRFGLGKIHDQLQQEAAERATREEPTAAPPPSSDEDNVTATTATEDEQHLIEINFTEWPYRYCIHAVI